MITGVISNYFSITLYLILCNSIVIYFYLNKSAETESN